MNQEKAWVCVLDLGYLAPQLIKVKRTRASRQVTAGERVLAFEPDDRVMAPAEVRIIDLTDNTIHLDIRWDQITEDTLGFFNASGTFNVDKIIASLPDELWDV